MRGSDIANLDALVNAAEGWKQDASEFGVNLTQINTVFPDGKPVVLTWDDSQGAGKEEWSISSSA